jgi:hypothetical protein
MNPWFKTLAAATCIVGDEARRTKKGIVTLAKYSRLSSRFGSAMSALSR